MFRRVRDRSLEVDLKNILILSLNIFLNLRLFVAAFDCSSVDGLRQNIIFRIKYVTGHFAGSSIIKDFTSRFDGVH